MVRGCGYNMTSPTLVRQPLEGLLLTAAGAVCARFVLPKGVWTVSTLTSALCGCPVTWERLEEYRLTIGMSRRRGTKTGVPISEAGWLWVLKDCGGERHHDVQKWVRPWSPECCDRQLLLAVLRPRILTDWPCSSAAVLAQSDVLDPGPGAVPRQCQLWVCPNLTTHRPPGTVQARSHADDVRQNSERAPAPSVFRTRRH